MPMASGRATVTTAGTAVPLAASSKGALSVTITALSSNTGIVVVGGSDVVAAVGTRKGAALEKGQTLKWSASLDAVDDLNQVFLDATVNGEGVSYAYTTRH